MESSKMVDRYSLLQRIAEGSYGQVYKALDKSTKQLVAVKRFKGSSRIGLPTSFVREHYIVTVLTGKHIPKVLDVFSADQPPVIVMEWLNMTLEQVLKSKKKYAIKEFFLQIVLAIDHLHSSGFIHRDLKPSNIMLGVKSSGNAPQVQAFEISPNFYNLKLIDFGMTREQAWENRKMTNQVGTLFYRAPQLLAGQKCYNSKVDVWSLGCIFYFMQTGTSLFKGTSQIDQFKTIVTILGTQGCQLKKEKMIQTLKSLKLESLPEKWSTIEKHINEIQLDFLKQMIVLDPEKRFSCKELLLHPYFRDQ